MGKASRRKADKARGTDSTKDRKRISQAIRRLDLIDSRMTAELWYSQAVAKIGEDDVRFWDNFQHDDFNDLYDFTYATLDRALTLSVSPRSWPLEVECAWMLPRLREAMVRSDGDTPVIVEIGAGPGVAAAILSAALATPIICVDTHPLTAGLPEQLAERTGGSVTSHVADAAEIGLILDGRVPAAVFGMSVFRHFQTHKHEPVFSFVRHMDAILARGHASEAALEFYEAIEGADLILSEKACPDYVAEVAAGAQRFGYQVPVGGLTQLAAETRWGPSETTGMHFTRNAEATGAHLLVENFSPLPQPRAGMEIDSAQAEALRWSLGTQVESLEVFEVNFTNEPRIMKRERFRYGDLFGQYSSTNTGGRKIAFSSDEEWAEVSRFILEEEKASIAAGEVTMSPLPSTPLDW